MSTPPEASTEYSRGSAISRGLRGWRGRRSPRVRAEPRATSSAALAGVLLCASVGAMLVIVSQFTPLYHVHSVTSSAAIRTVATGAHHAYAPIPLALLAICFAVAFVAGGSRALAAGIFVLGLAALGIALLGDLPDAQASGLIASGSGGAGGIQYVPAAATPSIGLYMETLGAVLLLLSGGIGLLMGGRRPAPARVGGPARRFATK